MIISFFYIKKEALFGGKVGYFNMLMFQRGRGITATLRFCRPYFIPKKNVLPPHGGRLRGLAWAPADDLPSRNPSTGPWTAPQLPRPRPELQSKALMRRLRRGVEDLEAVRIHRTAFPNIITTHSHNVPRNKSQRKTAPDKPASLPNHQTAYPDSLEPFSRRKKRFHYRN